MQQSIMIRIVLLILIVTSVNLAFIPAGHAAHPLITDDTGTQGKGLFQIEVTAEYANDNGNTETSVGSTISSGIFDKADVIVSIPYIFLRAKNESREMESEEGISDISLSIKWRFYEHDGFSLAFKPGIKFATGNEEKGLGDSKPSYSLFLITSKELEPFTFHINTGYTLNRSELRDILHISFAIEYAVLKNFRIVANTGYETNPDKESNVHPIFLLGGFIYRVTDCLETDFGVKTGLNKAETDYTLLTGITYRF